MEPGRISKAWKWTAFGWGVAEAVLFFIVPDVLLTYIATRYGLRRGIQATWWALGGAVIGGLIAFGWGATYPAAVNTGMEALPAVDIAMVETVAEQVATEGPAALVTAPLHGRPYKLYAAASGQLDQSALQLALWTIPGRLWRFLGLVTLFGALHAGSQRWRRQIPARAVVAFWAIFWATVYARFWFE